MNRPLERCGIVELEVLVRKKGNTETELEVIEDELMRRSTSRAAKLLTDVHQARQLSAMIPKIRAKFEAAKLAQTELPGMAGSEPAAPVVAVIPALSAPEPASLRLTPAKSPVAPLPKMTVEQAYKCLKVSPSAGWEQVENSRREIVAKAQPDRLEGLSLEKRKALQDESRLANAAYKSLLPR